MSGERAGECAEISTRLRAMVEKLRLTPTPQLNVIPLLKQAADEADRFYSGMMAWKRAAEAKDDLSVTQATAVDQQEKIALTAELAEALRFILAFYEPGQDTLNRHSSRVAEQGGRAVLAKFDSSNTKELT
jgi:hypothetical protein